jgi:SAM-dependent methyltransferase
MRRANKANVMSLLSHLKAAIPAPLKPIAKTIYYKAFRLQLRVRFWHADRSSNAPSEVPVPPAILRYRVSELISVPEFLRVGMGCADLIRQHVREMGIDLASTHRVLDFGCGCGRTIRWFLQYDSAEFHGVDVDEEAIDWCKRHLRRGHFLATAPTPPLPYPPGHFDVIYCLSVFTHLNESMQDSWLLELRRILKPGGMILLTIYGASASQELDIAGQTELQTEGFIHKRSQKLKGLVPDWYHTTLHSPEYIVNRLSVCFEDVHHYIVPDGEQDLVAARKAFSSGSPRKSEVPSQLD